MRTIFFNEWKYEIAFDDVAYKDVKRYSLKLNTLERELMEEEINFYRNHFSYAQLLDYFRKARTSDDRQTLIKNVIARLNQVLYMPIDLRDYYLKIVENEFKEYKEFFTMVMDKALSQSKKNIYVPLYKKILGMYYKPALKTLKRYAERNDQTVNNKYISLAKVESEARARMQTLSRDTYLHRFWGRNYVRHTVPIEVLDKEGLSKWNSQECSYSPNKLTILGRKMTESKLDFDITRTVYPGMAHFYNTVLKDPTENVKFDNGATFLKNGWALFAGWHAKPSSYIRNSKKEHSIIELYLLDNNLQKAYKNVYVYLLTKYDQRTVRDALITFSQYPGLYESYVLGALATELTIDVGFANNPEHYLQTISEINMGDFFAIYTPKVQKKLAKTSITARVARNFR